MIVGQGTQEPAEGLVNDQRLANGLMRPLTTAETAAAHDWLEDSWEEIRGRVPTLDARRAAGLTTDGQLRKVLTAMVVRMLRNPAAIRQYQIDDGTIVRDAALSAGLLYLTADELALLSGTPLSTGEPQHLTFSMRYQ